MREALNKVTRDKLRDRLHSAAHCAPPLQKGGDVSAGTEMAEHCRAAGHGHGRGGGGLARDPVAAAAAAAAAAVGPLRISG